MKTELHNFLKQWWKGLAKCLPYDTKVQHLTMAASCMWLVGHPDVTEDQLDEMIKEWLEDTNPM